MMDTSTVVHYSEIEVQDLLDSLTEPDIARLLHIYRTLGCTARTGLSEHDVLGQVTVKALSLDRRWPRDVKIMSFFIETGKSVISNEEEKYSKLLVTPTVDDLLITDDDSLAPTSAIAKIFHAPAESVIEHGQSERLIATWIQNIKQLFEGDTEADCFITVSYTHLTLPTTPYV